ncbi:type II toxin-antitoxin system VapC family toxin [Microbacterium protaetiae]|uniref:Ribonuclease VapC n=1 Tax=Microbacterium protaetiae TaxID=2509458 RepID=A0A4P6EFM4_9MICO|nr:type II toxin-antitoxin system VapC family toxin [Microbacterium protaetiae]QAY61190.1 type II toxin-antitoxin system VapC family toxin [Microbacterium protaetiae]
MSETPVVADTSAIAAVILGENDADVFADALNLHAGNLLLSEVTRFELSVVVEAKHGAQGLARLASLLDDLDVSWMPVDAVMTRGAIAAWQRFSKGHHAARLNMGDCFSYALAHELDTALLYKGDGFGQTDIRSAMERRTANRGCPIMRIMSVRNHSMCGSRNREEAGNTLPLVGKSDVTWS